ncbi:hypothetical protein ABPG72_018405 [Tetrahymena utriculariae]
MAFYVCKNKERMHYSELALNESQAKKHTLNPITTGSSVIGIAFNGGVIIASDTAISYGGMLRYNHIQRVHKVTDNCAFASSGEFADFQELSRLIDEMTNQTYLNDDNITYTPRDYGNYISQLQYHYRNKMNPLYLWNVIGGINNDKPYLAHIDLYGTYIEANHVSTGFGNYLCGPLFEKGWRADMSEQEAKQLVNTCFQALFYRDARAHETIQVTVIDKNGVRIEQPYEIESKWDFQGFVNRANEKIHNQ